MVRRLVLALLVLLALPAVTTAQSALTYDITWFAEVGGGSTSDTVNLSCQTSPPPGVQCLVQGSLQSWSITSLATATTTATVGLLPDGRLRIQFPTPAGWATLDAYQFTCCEGRTYYLVDGTFPVYYPPEEYGGPGFQLEGVWQGSFGWTGRFDAPHSFTVFAGIPGSGPSPQVNLRAFAVRRPMNAAIASPAAGATVSGTTSVSMQVDGPIGQSNTFTLSVDGQVLWTAEVPGSSAGFGWDTTRVVNGPHTLTFSAVDSAGQRASTNRQVNVSNPTGQSVTITAPTSGQVVSGTTPIRITTTGFTGSRTWAFLVDGRQWQTGTTTNATFTVFFNTTRVPNGTHTFTVRVGTVSASVQVTVRN